MRTRNQTLASVLRLQAQRMRLQLRLKTLRAAKQVAIASKVERELDRVCDQLR